MATEIRVPTLGESVSEATIGKWFKKPGDAVKADEPLVELETDKVTLEVNAPAAGVLAEIVAKDGETVTPGALLGQIAEGQSIELKKTFSNAVEQSLKSAPAGSETVVAAVKSALAQADSAYETMSRQAKQAKATIEANVAAANAATLKLMSQAA